ncbi:MAG: oligosaccharide flippase family protein [Verrucomicrobiota bacterium]
MWKDRLVAATPERWRGHWLRLEQSPLGGRLARGAFWSVAGGVAARSLGLLAGILVARLLDRDRYGEIAMIQSTVGLFGVLAGAGMGVTATKHVAEWRRQDPGRAARLIRLSNRLAWAGGLLVAALVGGWAPALARYAMGLPELGMELRISAGLLLFGAVQGAQAGALAGLESFRVLARLNLLAGLVSCPFLVVGAWMGGVAGTLWGLNGAAALGCLLHHLALRQEMGRAGLPEGEAWGRRDLPVLWQFTLPAALGALVTAAVQCGCMSLIARQPAGREALGAFNAANQWFLALMFLPNLLAQSVLPLMSEQLGQARHRQGRRLLGLSLKLNLLVAVPVLVLCVLSPWLMHLFGRSFRGEWPTLVAVLLTAVFLSLQTPVGQVLTAGGRVWVGFWMNLGWAAVFVAGTFAWGSWGALGLATARLAAYAAHTVWAMWYALRLLRRED